MVGVVCHSVHQGFILGVVGVSGLLEVQFAADDLLVEVVVGEVCSGAGVVGVGGDSVVSHKITSFRPLAL